MKFTHEFKAEFTKAIKLSGFITILVFGVLLIQNRTSMDDQNRSIASVSDDGCVIDANGNTVSAQGRSTPPFERKPCVQKKRKK